MCLNLLHVSARCGHHQVHRVLTNHHKYFVSATPPYKLGLPYFITYFIKGSRGTLVG